MTNRRQPVWQGNARGGSGGLLSSGGGSGFPDGSPNAPSGTPQLPSLLNGYVSRPPWRVAGVDYPVGIDRALYPTNASLADPAPGGVVASSLTALGGTWAIASNQISVTNIPDNTVIQGYDFSLHNCLALLFFGTGSNITIKNCNWVSNPSTPVIQSFIGNGNSNLNFTIRNCFLDMVQGYGGQSGFGMLDGANNVTLLYNYIANSWAENFTWLAPTGAGASLTIKYNVFRNGGWGFSAGAHGDLWQLAGAAGTDPWTNIDCGFNLFLQDADASGPKQTRCQGITWAPQSAVNAENFYNNTVISTSIAILAQFVGPDTTWLGPPGGGPWIGQSNYVDPSGQQGGPVFFITSSGGGPYTGTFTVANNVNMLTGLAIT